MKTEELTLNDAELLRENWNVLKDQLPPGIEYDAKDFDTFVKAYLVIENILSEPLETELET